MKQLQEILINEFRKKGSLTKIQAKTMLDESGNPIIIPRDEKVSPEIREKVSPEIRELGRELMDKYYRDEYDSQKGSDPETPLPPDPNDKEFEEWLENPETPVEGMDVSKGGFIG